MNCIGGKSGLVNGDDMETDTEHGGIQALPLYAKELLAGGVAGGLAKTSVAPFERIKILFQTKQGEFQQLGVWKALIKILKTEGIPGLYRGNGASVTRIVPYAALHYMTYEQYRRWILLDYPVLGTGPLVDLIAGSFAGGTAVLCTYPLDLARTKLAFQLTGPYHKELHCNAKSCVQLHPSYRGITDVFLKVYKDSGLRGLYRGVGPSLYGIFPYAGLKFYFYEELKRHLPKNNDHAVLSRLACGSLAGLLGQTFTYPLDVVRRQMQVQTLVAHQQGLSISHLEEYKFKGTLDGLLTIIRRQGWRQLFAGLSINYLKVVPSVAIGFTTYDGMKSLLGVPSHEPS